MTIYLSIDQLIEINLEMVEAFGGKAGIRDRGALEAAEARPRNAYYRDLIEKGAALCESLLQNHPFIDGNKRTAIAATAVFYEMNGYSLKFGDRELYDWLINLYNTGQVNKKSLEHRSALTCSGHRFCSTFEPAAAAELFRYRVDRGCMVAPFKAGAYSDSVRVILLARYDSYHLSRRRAC